MLKVLLPLLVLAGVVAFATVSDTPAPRADFRFINRGDVKTLDPQRMSWMQDLRVARIVYEGLVRLDVLSEDYAIIPGVAERWEISDDQKTYTFFLREDARYSNGEPVLAGDFVYSWRRAIMPDTSADYASLFHLIEGAPEFFQWRQDQRAAYAERAKSLSAEDRPAAVRAMWAETERAFDDMVGLKAIDDMTLEIKLSNPTPYWLDLCAFAVFSPVYPALVEQYFRLDPNSGMASYESGWTKPPDLVTNGPFMLTDWRFKREMRFEQNPYWWDAESLDVNTIEVVSIEDPNAAVLAYETGSVQWVSDVTVDYKIRMREKKLAFYEENRERYEELKAQGLDQFAIDAALPDDPRKDLHWITAFGTYWYNFNCRDTLPDGRDNPFKDNRVRRAFAMAIDKQALVDDVQRIGNPVARSLIPPGSIGNYSPPAGLKCVSDGADESERRAIIDEARALLADAGYPNPGEDLPTIELLFNKDAGHDLIAQAIAKDWERNLGVKTLLAQKEIKVFADDLKNHNFMTSRAGWYGDYADPTTFLDLSVTDNGNNDRDFSSPVFDDLMAQASVELDQDKRMRMLEEAERMIMEDELPMVPLFHYVSMYLFDADELTGLNPHPRTQQDMYLIDVLGDGIGRDKLKPIRPAGGGGSTWSDTSSQAEGGDS